jgi:hypothetical protein
MKTAKAFVALAIISLFLMASLVSAAEAKTTKEKPVLKSNNLFSKGWASQINRERSGDCTWIRPATEFRPAAKFPGYIYHRTGECLPFGKSFCQRNPQAERC